MAADAQAYNILPKFVEVETFAAVFDLIKRGKADAGIVNRLFGTQQKDNFGLQETDVVLYPSRLMSAGIFKKTGEDGRSCEYSQTPTGRRLNGRSKLGQASSSKQIYGQRNVDLDIGGFSGQVKIRFASEIRRLKFYDENHETQFKYKT